MKHIIYPNKVLPFFLLCVIGLLGFSGKVFAQGGFVMDINAQVVVEGTASIVIADGKWQNDGIFEAGTGLVRIEGTGSTANSTIGGLSTSGSFYDLTLNKASNAAQLVNDIVVSHQLFLTSGPLDLNTHQLTLDNSDSNAVARTSGYLLSEQPNNSSTVAWFIGTAAGVHTIPFGAISGIYIPMEIRVTSGNVDTVRVSTYPTNGANLPLPVTPTLVTNVLNDEGLDNSANTVDRFWEVNPTGSTGVISLTLNAQLDEVGTVTNLVAQRWDSLSDTWDAPLPGQISSATAVTVPNVSEFTTFAIAEAVEPLRVEFLSFDAYVNGSKVMLKWVTGSETNSDHFSVQRSADGYSFTEIGTEAAAGNSYVVLRYSSEDLNPLKGRSFYRIVEYDVNGGTVTSDMRAVYFEELKSMTFSVYPNPITQGNLQLRIVGGEGETVTIRLADMLGKVLISSELKLNDDIVDYSFEIIPFLAKGNYVVWIASKLGNKSFKVIVQ